MKSLQVITFTFLTVSAVCGFFGKVAEISDPVNIIEFDSDSNIYVNVKKAGESSKIYKLDSAKNVTYVNKFDLFTNVIKIFVTKLGNVYIFDSVNPIIYVWRNGSYDMEAIRYPWDRNVVAVKDQDDNIFFNTQYGVSFIKHDGLLVTTVINLEEFKIYDHSSYIDLWNGYIYLGGFQSEEPVVAILGPREKDGTVPIAKVAKPASPFGNAIISVCYFKEHIYFGFGVEEARIYIASYNTYDFYVVFAQYDHSYTKFTATQNRMYFFSYDGNSNLCNLNYFYYNSSLQVGVIQSGWKNAVCNSAMVATDGYGNLFMTYDDQVLYIRDGETEIRGITFLEEPTSDVTSMLVDQNNDLWILRGSLFRVKKGTTVAENLTGSVTAGSTGILKINGKTNEVYIGVQEGLFFYSD